MLVNLSVFFILSTKLSHYISHFNKWCFTTDSYWIDMMATWTEDRVIWIFEGAWKLSVYLATFSAIQAHLCIHASWSGEGFRLTEVSKNCFKLMFHAIFVFSFLNMVWLVQILSSGIEVSEDWSSTRSRNMETVSIISWREDQNSPTGTLSIICVSWFLSCKCWSIQINILCAGWIQCKFGFWKISWQIA